MPKKASIKKSGVKKANGVKKPRAKSAAKKSATAKPAALKAIIKPQTRTEIFKHIAEETGLAASQIKAVFEAAGTLSKRHIMKRGSGKFAIPGFDVVLNRKTKPATKKREGRNPKTGETIMIAAKPKREVVKARALKALKEN